MNSSSLQCQLYDCCESILSNAPFKSKNVSSRDNLGAVAYTLCILSLFSSLIFLLMIRSIRPRDDDQINYVLLNMRIRVDKEEKRRREFQMREAKKRAQKWLGQLASKRLSFRRTNSDIVESIRSVPLINLKPRIPYRATSYQGFLPEIVVTGESSFPLRTSHSINSSRQSSFGEGDDSIDSSYT